MDATVLWILLGAALGGFVQGLAGFAFGLVALGVWAWVVPPQLAGPMVVFGSLLGQLLSVVSVRHALEARRALPFIVGGTLGVPLGVLLLRYIDPTLFRLAVGVVLAVYCSVLLFARNFPRVEGGGRLADGGAGFVGGLMGGIAGLTGPAPTLWCTLRGWGKDVQRAVFQTFNIAMHSLTLTGYAVSGLVTSETLGMFALVAPALLVPTYIGTQLYKRFSDSMFRRLLLLLLSGSGVVLMVSALADLASG